MSNLTPFTFESHAVRVVQIDAEPWFVAADVCHVLGLGNVGQALARLDDDEKSSVSANIINGDVANGGRDPAIINESGLYSLILTSRKPEAKRFKKWVTAEVLPSIRRTGGYQAAPEANDLTAVLEDPAKMRHLLLHHVEARMEAERQLAEAQPILAAYDRLAGADGSVCITDAAKSLQMQPRALFAWLSANKWIYRRAGCAHWVAYQDRIQALHLEHKVTEVTRGDGTAKITEQVRVTRRGMALLAKRLGVPEAEAA